MAVTPAQKAALEKAASTLDVSVDVLLEVAEEELAKSPTQEKPSDDEGKPEDKVEAKPAGEAKVFQYHLPFMTVAEVRSQIGLPTDGVPDAGLVTGAWLAKHGGQPSDSPTPGVTGARTDDESAKTGRGDE